MEEVNQELKEFNDSSVQMKEYYLKDMPDCVKEEAGLSRERKRREKKKKGEVYKAEKVENYQGDKDIDTILKNLEKTTSKKGKNKAKNSVVKSKELVPEKVTRKHDLFIEQKNSIKEKCVCEQ